MESLFFNLNAINWSDKMEDGKIKIGIYCIENLINNKKYIGQSKNIYRRWKQHIKDSEIKQLPLYKSIRKYGIENFKFFILEECKITELSLREDYYITYYKKSQYSYIKSLYLRLTAIKIAYIIVYIK